MQRQLLGTEDQKWTWFMFFSDSESKGEARCLNKRLKFYVIQRGHNGEK